MAKIFSKLIEGTLAEFFSTNPNTKREGTRFVTDTGSTYIVQNGMWKNENPLLLSLETVNTKFMPFPEQTGLTFGSSFWISTFAELVGDGSMLYYTKTSATVVNTGGYFGVDDYARPDLLPKIQIMFKVDDATSSNAVFVGLIDDSLATSDLNTAVFVPDAKVCVGMGTKSADTNWQVYHNDGAGAIVSIDTGMPRDTNPHELLIQYVTDSSVYLSISDVNGNIEYYTTLTTEIPVTSDELGFIGAIINTDIVARYGLYIYDYVYLEKRLPATITGVVV